MIHLDCLGAVVTIAAVISSNNVPAGAAVLAVQGSENAWADLGLMLRPLRDLPGLRVSDDFEPNDELPDLIEATLELQLDAAAPHLDCVAQLSALLHRLLATPGVQPRPEQRAALERLMEPQRHVER